MGSLLGVIPLHAQDGIDGAVRRAAEQELASRFPERADRLEVRVRSVRSPLDSAAQLRVDFPEREEPPGGLTQVEVHTRASSGQWEGTGWARLHVARYDSVLTVRNRVRAGEAITFSKVQRAWREVTDFQEEPLQTGELRARLREGPLVASRFVRADRVLRGDDVRPPYAANTGATIEVHHGRGRVTLLLSCTAREPGFVGDVIRVYCPDFRTTYRARVTGRDTARWIETL